MGASETHTATARVWRDADHFAQATADTPEDAMAMAMEQSQHGRPDLFGGPIPNNNAPDDTLDIDDPRWHRLTENERRALLLAIERTARIPERRITPITLTYADSRTVRRFVSTTGCRYEKASTRFELAGSVSATDRRQRFVVDDRLTSRNFATVASLPFGQLLAQRALAMATNKPIGGDVSSLMLPPRASATLIDYIARSLLHGTENHWIHTKAPFSSVLHIVDDRTLPGGWRTVAFDDRGTRPVPLVIMTEGQPSAHYYTLAQAREHGAVATGHMNGPHLEVGNLKVRGGLRAMMTTIIEHGKPTLLIDDLIDIDRIHPRSGKFELEVSGQVFVGNEMIGSRRRVLIKGNMADALQSIVAATSNEDRYGHVDAPGLLLTGIEVEELD